MIAKKKEFTLGAMMMVAFIVVLVIFFSPVFGGKNGLDYLDNLYNSISKGSAYYVEKVKHETDKFAGTSVDLTLAMASPIQADQTAKLYNQAGALVNVTDKELKVSGDLGKILEGALIDADSMYHNDGNALSGKYGYDPRQALYNWWKSLTEAEKFLNKGEHFKEAKIVHTVVAKTVETSYNYYGIEAQKIGDKYGIVIISLVFYVIYTLWYGFSIMFMFEGWGMQLEH